MKRTLGPWEAGPHKGASGAHYFAIERHNPKVWGGTETMMTKGWKPRRFNSLEAAQKVADAANAAARDAEGTQP